MAAVTWISSPTLSFNRKLSTFPCNEKLFAGSAAHSDTDESLKLRYTWVLWEQSRQAETAEVGSAAYGDLTRNIATIQSVQEFWSIFNKLPQPSELLAVRESANEEPQPTANAVGSFMLFKQGIRPEWEDVANKTGGHFQFTLQTDKFRNITKENTSIKDGDILGILDEYWNNLVLALIGNTLPHLNDITGIRLVDKVRHGKGSKPQGHVRVEVWFTETTKVDSIREGIERILKTRPNGETVNEYIPGFRLDTRFHDDQSMQQCTAELLANKKRLVTGQVSQVC